MGVMDTFSCEWCGSTVKVRRKPLWILLLWIALLSPACQALDLDQCRNALGMQSGAIPDEAISASSSYDQSEVGPENARIRTERKGGAWCPKQAIQKDVFEYLQIDLDQLMVITMVETQGRFGNGKGQEFAKKFLLEYQREEDTNVWKRFRDKKGVEVFPGNDNTYLAELRHVQPPIIAKRLRFIPYSSHPRTICMRVEIYGCEWEDGLVSYSMPQGGKRGAEVDLFDFTYDGLFQSNYLKDGLGQLADGEEGDTNFRLDSQRIGIKGYEWIGWKNDTNSQKPIEIIYKFDTVRNFSAMILHCNNHYSKEVRVFRKAEIYFSVGGKYYSRPPIQFNFVRDDYFESARQVIIRLYHNVGQYIKMDLYFDAKWMMISEVKIESEVAHGNFTPESPPPTTFSPTTSASAKKNKHMTAVEIDIFGRGSNTPKIELGDAPASQRPFSGDKSYSGDEEYTINRRQKKKGATLNGDDVHKKKEETKTDDGFIGIIIAGLAALIVILVIIIVIFVIRHKRRKNNNNRRSLKPVVDHHAINLNDLCGTSNGKVSNGNMYNCVATDELDSEKEMMGDGKLSKPAYLEPKDTIQGSRDYAVPDVTKSALVVNLPPRPARPPMSLPAVQVGSVLDKPPNYDALYAAADIVNVHGANVPSMQGVSGNNVYAVPNADLLLSIDYSVLEFPRENLRFVEVLGEGQFGEVHLCEALRINDILGDEYMGNRTNTNRSMLVAVKMLRPNADDRARADFHKEVKIMSQLKDPNIVHVLGVCTREEPLCMIVEYMKYGDLNQFILEHVPESPVAEATNAKTLSYGCLIFIASQIASGMKYLESLNMVHRDLATRNCLVGTNYLIKISDFGMSRSLYSADYYRIEGRAVLPIRWMAWESILLGKFTTKSDVWSFAVTLWEVLTFNKDQPYDVLTDEQVIENAGHYYRNDNLQVYLPQPPNCPKEIYDLMRECWNRQESERPTFREIHMFLQRKNMGYNPKDEKLSQITVPVC
ncbi:discoidin domain-containing receptor 2-like isoform X2 [Gigantopelta aegis]|uniref:discoidin domain-containing receptor 2-like isoform X2 n=1 Tax=Gigantopelta aegis TaxID=1735272 RepID=UPI001B88DF81|nr:discoidin domain-containing receptor 2-like isoform X2 [Gigantopelta aegis]